MRESLFEKLKKKDLSFVEEMEKISDLLGESSSTRVAFANAFKRSPFNVSYKTFNEALLDIFESDKAFATDFSDRTFRNFLYHASWNGADLTLDCFLDYLEFFRTLMSYIKSDNLDLNYGQIASIVLYDCEKIGYVFKTEDNGKTYRTMLKNPLAESVSLKVNESTREKIDRYLMIRKGKAQEKRECIKSLADDVEIICKKYANITEYDKLKQFIQCTRHTKDEPKKEFPFYYESEEEWLDKTFEMIIGILSFTRTKEIVTEIIKLERKKTKSEFETRSLARRKG